MFVSNLGQRDYKIELLWRSSILEGVVVAYQKHKTKKKRKISGLKSGRSRLRNLRSGRFRESFWNSIWVRNKTRYLQSGRLREVVAMTELTLFYR